MKMLFTTLLAISMTVNAAEYGNVAVSEITSIYDADTFTVNIHGWPEIVGKRISVRIKGIDAPELHGRCDSEVRMAREAKQYTVAMLRSAKVVELRNIQRDKYFRILADVYVDNESVAEALMIKGLVRVYTGGKKQNWCAI